MLAVFVTMDHFVTGAMDTTDWLDQCLQVNRSAMSEVGGHDRNSAVCSGDEGDSDKGELTHRGRGGSKPHSTPQTLKWLDENYEMAEGVCIPRSTLYYHYLDFCEAHDTQPVNAASFGKIIRQQFPQITTRRLGTRGQSKYHYYGIGVKETSSYFEVIYSAKGVQSAGDGRKEPPKPPLVAYSPRSKLGTLLPEFPDIRDVKVPPGMEEAKVLTFLMMYRTHCQRILDTVIRANFDEVQNFLLHFWQGMPPHIVPILGSGTVVTLVGVCDSILYRAIANVLMPTVLQALPDSLTQVIRRFAKQLEDWLKTALSSLPDSLQNMKFDLARRFAQVLRRQTSLNHLCQAARSVLQSPEITAQLLEDWLSVDLGSVVKQTLYTMDQYSYRDHCLISNLCGEFERMLEEQAPLECIMEWLDKMVDKCVVRAVSGTVTAARAPGGGVLQPSSRRAGTLRQTARQFLLMWSCFGTRVIRDMTLHSAPSFGSFHLLHLMFDDYILYRIEALHAQERVADFMRVVKGEDNLDLSEECVLPDPQALKESFTSLETLMPRPYCQQSGGCVYQNRSTVITTHNSNLLTNIPHVMNDAQDYDSQQDGYTTDESGSLEQIPSPRGGLDAGIALGSGGNTAPNVYNGVYSSGYPGQYSKGMGLHMTPPQGYQQLPMNSHAAMSTSSQGREAMMSHTSSRLPGPEWSLSQELRHPQQDLSGEPSGAMTYGYAPSLRHGGYDPPAGGGYPYDATAGGSGGMTYQGYGGLSGLSDAFVTSGMGDVSGSHKRRPEEEQQLQSCKRPAKEAAFYFQPNFTNIG